MAESTSPVATAQAVLDRVYSPFTGPSWTPKAFPSRCRRYLWSDAFGVCNFISLFYAGGRVTQYLDQADLLITDVHNDLGCYRNSTQRLPGASEVAPTRGGLRIGKEDEQEDGQYFHYLTKWMFALNRMSLARDDTKYNDWAVDLARVGHDRFVIRGLGGRPLRMVWKKSVDLERVLVSSEGNLDPMDALVVYRLIQTASNDKNALMREIAEMQHLVDRKLPSFATHDALDSGEALWVSQWFREEKWSQELEDVALGSIERLFRSGRFQQPAGYRLMFREMGMVLGLEVAMPKMTDEEERRKWRERVQRLLRFWEDKVYARDEDITPLMYAAARLPGVWDPQFDTADVSGDEDKGSKKTKSYEEAP